MRNHSKPTRALTAFCLCTCLLLAACTTPSQAESTPPAEQDSEPHAEAAPLFIASQMGTVTTPNGFYESRVIHRGATSILYTDYATGTQRYLCEDTACLHNNAACTSYFPFTDVPYTVFYTGGSIIVGHTAGGPPDDTVYIADANGANRRALFTYEPNHIMLPMCYTDGQTMYTVMASMEPGTYNTLGHFLAAINLETGAIENILDFEQEDPQFTPRNYYSIESAYENKLCILRLDMDMADTVEAQYLLVDPAAPALDTEIASFFFSKDYALLQNGILYMYNADSRMITYTDLATGEEHTVQTTPALPDGNPAIRGAANGMLFYQETTQDKLYHALVDTQTQTVTGLTLSIGGYHNVTPLYIIGQHENDLCVLYTYEYVNGEPVARYAMLAIEDYLTSTPNYRYIVAVDQ